MPRYCFFPVSCKKDFPVSDSLSFNYVRTTDDYWRAVRAYMLAELSRWYVLASVALALAALVFVAVGLLKSWFGVDVLTVAVLALVINVPIMWWIVYRHWNNHKRLAPSIDEEITGIADSDGISLSCSSDRIELTWMRYFAAAENPDCFLLEADVEANGPGPALYNYIPKRAFANASTLGAFRELIRGNVRKARLLA